MFKRLQKLNNCFKRPLSLSCPAKSYKSSKEKQHKGLVLGAYTGCDRSDVTLTPVASKYSSDIGIDIKSILSANTGLLAGEVRIFDNLTDEFRAVAVAGLGPDPGDDVSEEMVYARREYVRNAAGAGARELQERGIDEIFVEHMVDGEAAAEGATLGVWTEQQFKSENQLTESSVYLYEKEDVGKHAEKWTIGVEKATGQNFARYLTQMPANVMTPTIFGQHCAEELCPCGVSVEVHDHKWIKQKGMKAFLTIAQGSCEPPVLVELKYSGGGNDHVVIVGKGCTFDSGGECLSECETMMYRHADKAGAAVVAGLFKAMCKLKIPATVTALLPMYENLPSENAVKTGSLLHSLNERTIRVLHPRHEGRVVLSDVLGYAACLNPKQVLNIATLSDSMGRAMGTGASGIFSTSEKISEILVKSGETNGDRVWPFPFYDNINLSNTKAADFGNQNNMKGGNTLFGAAFLKEFAPPAPVDFVHIDVSGTVIADQLYRTKYLREGFATGRPVRTLVDYFTELSKANY